MVEVVTTTHRRETSDGYPSIGPLVLRICGSPRAGQTIRLASTKCTIGSGEHCTLRIRARGVQPLHCILIRKAARTVVRRWATDTRLNGASFSDAPVDAGDRLTIGPIEFEILESGAIPTSGTSRDRALSAKSSRGVGKGDSLVEHRQPAKDLTRKRTVKILRRLRHANRRIADLTKELEKHNFTGEFTTSAERGARRCRVEQDGLRTEQSLLEEAQTLLRERQADLEAASERWKGEQERSEVESQARGVELERRANKTESAGAELDSLREALAKEREAIEAERARYEQLAADIAEQRAELERQLGTAAREAY